MLKKYLVYAGIILLASTSLAFAADGNLNSKDGKIAVGTGATEFTFQTSPQVQTKGTSNAQNFVIAAVHTATQGKAGGLAYAMSSETSGLYFKDVSGGENDFAAPTLDNKDITNYTLEGQTPPAKSNS